jgi:tripartite motif-containing protein 2/3
MSPRSLYPNLDGVATSTSSISSLTHLSPTERDAMRASLPVKYDSNGSVYAFGRYGDELVDFKDPVSMTVSSSGHVYVTDRSKNRVLVFGRNGKISRVFSTDGLVGCIALDNNNELLVAEANAGRGLVYRYDSDCQKKGSFGSMFSFEKSHALAFDATNSRIIVSTLETNMIYAFDLAGKLVNKFGGRGKGNRRFMSPLYVGANQSGQVLVVDSDEHCIKVYNSVCKYLYQLGNLGSGAGQLENPQGICVDRWDNVIVCDYGNARLQLFDKHGKYLVEMTRFAPGYHPKDVSYESHTNRLYILLSGHRKAEVRICDYYDNNPAKDASNNHRQC